MLQNSHQHCLRKFPGCISNIRSRVLHEEQQHSTAGPVILLFLCRNFSQSIMGLWAFVTKLLNFFSQFLIILTKPPFYPLKSSLCKTSNPRALPHFSIPAHFLRVVLVSFMVSLMVSLSPIINLSPTHNTT